MGRDRDAVTLNVETVVEEPKVRRIVRDQLRVLFGKHIATCEECGLAWGRKREEAGRREPDRTRCPDCGEEEYIYLSTL